ncbi:hypothetical protein MCOR02_011343 [Pyricularia oryzae]|nr:hypothetical protein MCOR02_011343 [Pyricularia oryzae]
MRFSDADGYARGESVVCVMLKTISQTLADGDHIEKSINELKSPNIQTSRVGFGAATRSMPIFRGPRYWHSGRRSVGGTGHLGRFFSIPSRRLRLNTRCIGGRLRQNVSGRLVSRYADYLGAHTDVNLNQLA